MTKEELLKIDKPGDLFDRNIIECKKKYKELIKEYHPDSKNGDTTVFEHITKLYEKAIGLLSNGLWEKSRYVEFKTSQNKTIMIEYQDLFLFELGTCYVCKTHIIYLLKSDKEKYYKNYIEKTKKLKYENNDMEKVFKICMPDIQTYGKLKTGEYYIVLKKTKDVFPLKNVLNYYKEIPDRHIAWILSRLSSIACFIQYNHLVHNGINIENCFISPKYHSILLLGGWCYTTKENEKLIGTTKEIYDLMPIKEKTKKISTIETDLESIKAIGRKLTGDEDYQKMLDKNLPKPIFNFLTKGSSHSAFTEMEEWDKSLLKAYGERKFIPLYIDEKQIYQ